MDKRAGSDKHETPQNSRNEEPFKTYVCRYFHNGSWWGLNITADDWQDAEARVAKLGNLQLEGELMATIPAKPGVGLLVRALCTIRNGFTKKNL